MKIEPAEARDLSEIAQLWHRSWLSTGPEDSAATTASGLRSRLLRENWELQVVRQDGRIVAFLALDPSSDIVAQMFVDPAFQRRRIGHFLLEHAKSRMPGGFVLRTDETNAGARRFYERSGLVIERCEDRRAYYRWPAQR